jgi:hypothetical protein
MKMDLFGFVRVPNVETRKVTREYLKEILHYDPETEEWIWLVNKGTNYHMKGTIAGSWYHEHWSIKIDGIGYRASHLLCLYITGKWPSESGLSFKSIPPPKDKPLTHKQLHRLLRREYFSEYKSWNAMRNRCLHETHEWYHRYGGRGITICDRWLNSFENFFEDMGRKPGPEYSLHRKDNDGNYEPGNCKWATIEEQMNNRSHQKRRARAIRFGKFGF